MDGPHRVSHFALIKGKFQVVFPSWPIAEHKMLSTGENPPLITPTPDSDIYQLLFRVSKWKARQGSTVGVAIFYNMHTIFYVNLGVINLDTVECVWFLTYLYLNDPFFEDGAYNLISCRHLKLGSHVFIPKGGWDVKNRCACGEKWSKSEE